MASKRIPLVAGNWKMNFDHLEATYFVQKLVWLLRDAHFDFKRCEVALFPSFTSLRSVQVLVEADKLGVIENLLDKANRLVIGGGMVFTFLKAKGYEVGTSLLEEDQLEKVKGYIETAEKNGVELVLPTDVVVNAGFPAGDTPVAPEVVAADAIPADKMGLDIGPESQKLFHDKIVDSKTVVWNGPMGVFEVPTFAEGTKAVAQALVDATAAGAFTIVGGGDSASAVRNLGFPEDGFSHISTGGGASLEFLEGKELPGLKVLD